MHPARKFPAVMAALVACLLLLPATSAAAVAPDRETVNESVVWVDVEWTGTVEVPFQDDTTEVYEAATVIQCTGWFVSDIGHVATAGHCLEADQSIVTRLYIDVIEDQDIGVEGLELEDLDWAYELDDPTAYVGQPSVVDGVLDDPTVAQIVAQQPFENGDNALLRIANLKGTAALAIADEQPEVGEEVVAIGFAGSVDDVTATDRQPPSHKSGSVSSLSTSTKGAPVTEIDAAVSGGMSGGPTINENGEVIGINSFGIVGESQPFNFVTDTESMRTFMEQNGVRLGAGVPVADESDADESDAQAASVPAPTAAVSDEGGVNWLVVVLVLVVLALVVAVAMMFFMMKRQRSAPAGAGSQHGPSDGQIP